MRVKIIIAAILFFFLTFVSTSFAAFSQGTILDSNNSPMIGAKVTVTDPVSKKVIGAAVSDFSGSYSLYIPNGTYDVTILSKTAKGQQTNTLSNHTISSSKQQNFKINAETNAPIPPQKNETPYVLIVFVSLLLIGGLFAFFVWKKTKKKNVIISLGT